MNRIIHLYKVTEAEKKLDSSMTEQSTTVLYIVIKLINLSTVFK